MQRGRPGKKPVTIHVTEQEWRELRAFATKKGRRALLREGEKLIKEKFIDERLDTFLVHRRVKPPSNLPN